jgi:hypothetical protein
MDTVVQYSKVIQTEFEIRASRRPVNRPAFERRLLTDKEGSEFILVSVGLHNQTFHHDILLHVRVKDGKVLILEDVTDPGIYEAMVERGIPSSDIIPVYMPDYDFATVEKALA